MSAYSYRYDIVGDEPILVVTGPGMDRIPRLEPRAYSPKEMADYVVAMVSAAYRAGRESVVADVRRFLGIES